MKEQLVSKAYAKAIIGLGESENVNVAEELTKLNVVINENNNLESLLFLDVFTDEEKMTVISEVCDKLKLSKIIKNTIQFLMDEGRIGLLPMIFKDVVVLDDDRKGFLKGVIEGSDDKVSDNVVNKISDYIESKTNKKTKLDYKINNNITAGYRVTVEDLQFDASLDNQLDQLKESILN